MRFTFSLLAVVAFAQDTTLAEGDGVPAEDTQEQPQDDAAVDTWTSELVWEEGTGVIDWEKDKNWNKKFSDGDQAIVGIPTTLTAGPDAEGNDQLTVVMEGGWPIEWADANNSKSKAISASLQMSWVATVDELDPEIPLTWEGTGVTVTRDNNGPVVSDLYNVTTNPIDDYDIDWTQVGGDITPLIADAAPVTVWQGAGEAITDGGNITGVRLEATRPFIPTAERASAITLVNQLPNYLCASVSTVADGISGSAEAGCALFTINIPVPEVEEEVVDVVIAPTGASQLTAAAFAAAAIAVMAF